MKKMLGVAAVILMGSPTVNASLMSVQEGSQLTTKDQKVTPHKLTLASFDRSKCRGFMVRLLPYCNN